MKKYFTQVVFPVIIACVIFSPFTDANAQQRNAPFDPETLARSRDYWPTVSWKTSSPEAQGMDSKQLEKAERFFHEYFPSSYSLLVIRHGYIVLEKYYNGQNKDTSNHIYSLTKSFMSALTGIAIKEGYIKSVDQKMLDFYPEYITQDMDPGKKDITIKHMLTHTSGLERGNLVKDDKLQNTVKGELVSIPGKKFSYSNSVPDLLSGIITKTTNMSTLEYANKKLFGPLGISIEKWNTTPRGFYTGAGGLYMTPHNLARLGYLYLNYGYWDGAQILTPEWVKESSQKHADFDEVKGYGYLMWVRQKPDKVQGYEISTYFPYGHRGQFIGIVPGLDLLVVMSANARDATRETYFVMDLIHDYVRMFIFPAITDIE